MDSRAVRPLTALVDVQGAQGGPRVGVASCVVAGSASQRIWLRRIIATAGGSLARALQELSTAFPSGSAEADRAATLASRVTDWQRVRDAEVLATVDAGDAAGARAALTTRLLAADDRMEVSLDQLTALSTARADAAVAGGQRAVQEIGTAVSQTPGRSRSLREQTATVAEPLQLQGWQLVDDLDRSLAGAPAPDSTPPPTLITTVDVPSGDVFEPTDDHRSAFRRAWGRG